MAKCLRRILATIATHDRTFRHRVVDLHRGKLPPAAAVAASSAPGQALPAINEQGYRRKEANTFFTFPNGTSSIRLRISAAFSIPRAKASLATSRIFWDSGAASAPSTAPCRRRRILR